MSNRPRSPGRHRLGTGDLVHCTEFAAVAAALAAHRPSWLARLLTPAKHSLAGLRRRSVAPELWWAPANAS